MSSSPSRIPPSAPGPDPAPKPTRRTFPAEYKLRILAEYESAPEGEGEGAEMTCVLLPRL